MASSRSKNAKMASSRSQHGKVASSHSQNGKVASSHSQDGKVASSRQQNEKGSSVTPALRCGCIDKEAWLLPRNWSFGALGWPSGPWPAPQLQPPTEASASGPPAGAARQPVASPPAS
eukprot:1160100-Pelagomonas_calceolata.AAC.8